MMEKQKKVYIIAMIKNEADIIEAFVRYHIQFIDGMVILDNFSSDKTAEILEGLQREGLNIDVIHDTDHEYCQAKKTNKLIDYAVNKHDAEVIIPLDADEFLVSKSGRDLRSYLQTLEENVVYLMRMHRCMMTDINRADIFASPIITKNEGAVKCLFLKQVLYDNNMRVCEGNHDVSRMIRDTYPSLLILDKIASDNKHLVDEACLAVMKDTPYTMKEIRQALNNVGIYYQEADIAIKHLVYRSREQFLSKNFIQPINVFSRADRLTALDCNRYLDVCKNKNKLLNTQAIIDYLIHDEAGWEMQEAFINNEFANQAVNKYSNYKVDYVENLFQNSLQLAKECKEIKVKFIELEYEYLVLLLHDIFKGDNLGERINSLCKHYTLNRICYYLDNNDDMWLQENKNHIVDLLPKLIFKYNKDALKWAEKI